MSKEKFKITLAPDDQENPEKSATPENPEKIFDSKGLEGKSHEEQVASIDSALFKLDDLSGDIKNALAETELGRTDEKTVIQESSLFSRMILKAKEIIHGENSESYDNKIAKMAKKRALENLYELEKLGEEVIALKNNMAKNEITTKNKLNDIRNLPNIDPNFVKSMEIKMAQEQELLELDKNEKEQELKSQIAGYPSAEKQEKIANLLTEYGEIGKSVTDRRRTLETNIKSYEAVYNKKSDERESSQDIKKHLEEQIEILKGQCQEMRDKENSVKERIDLLKANQKDLDPFVKKLNTMGKTRTEIAEEYRAKFQQNKKSADNQPAPDPKMGTENKENNQEFKQKSAGRDNKQAEYTYNRPADESFNPLPEDKKTKKKKPDNSKNKKQNNQQNAGHSRQPKSAAYDTSDETTFMAGLKKNIKNIPEFSKSARKWAEDIRTIVPKLAGNNDEITKYFEKKSRLGNLDTLAAAHLFLQFLVDNKKIKNFNDGTKILRQVIEKMTK
jgi:hypothetical protein